MDKRTYKDWKLLCEDEGGVVTVSVEGLQEILRYVDILRTTLVFYADRANYIDRFSSQIQINPEKSGRYCAVIEEGGELARNALGVGTGAERAPDGH